jgi:hypothetical protein
MVPAHIKDLVDSLSKKTEQKKAIWNTSSGENAFQIKLSAGMVTIDLWDGHGFKNYAGISVFNNNGTQIDSFSVNVNDDPEAYSYLEKFHAVVSRSYYKVEETIKGMLDEIKDGDEIGKEHRSEDSIDDGFPF